jgi:hypothetical protein
MVASGLVLYNGVPVSVETNLGKEVAKFEKERYNPDAPENQYPRMLYRARKHHGRVIVFDSVPDFSSVFIDEAQYQRVRADSVAFNNSAVCEVKNATEHHNRLNQGWSNTAEEALAAAWKHEHGLQEEAARLAFQDKGLSDKAKAEKDAYAATTEEVVAEVPVAPRRGGRPRKNQTEAN